MIEEPSLLNACSALVKQVGLLLNDMYIQLDTFHMLQSALGFEYRQAKNICEEMNKSLDS